MEKKRIAVVPPWPAPIYRYVNTQIVSQLWPAMGDSSSLHSRGEQHGVHALRHAGEVLVVDTADLDDGTQQDKYMHIHIHIPLSPMYTYMHIRSEGEGLPGGSGGVGALRAQAIDKTI